MSDDVRQQSGELDAANGHDTERSLRPPGRCRHGLAELSFDTRTSQYCLISHTADPEDLLRTVALKEPWGLRNPNLILSIMGGAGNMVLPPNQFDIDGFSKGLVEAATRTSAWVITGGTASGVMEIVGKAMRKHDKERKVPCLGITPYGALKRGWRDLICSEAAFEESCPANPKRMDAAEAKPEGAAVDDKPLAALQENHSHFIICDNGKVGSETFGTEIPFRTRFEDHVAKGEFNDVEGSLQVRVPRVMILLNGGKISLESLVQAIQTGCPLVVCRGTGRLADVICRVLEEPCSVDDEDENSFRSHLQETLHEAVKEFMPQDTLTTQDIEHFEAIVQSDMVVIYSINDRFEEVVLQAVLGHAGSAPTTSSRDLEAPSAVAVGQQLALAVQWGCSNYYGHLGQRLMENGDPNGAIKLIFKELVAFNSGMTPVTVVRSVRENAGMLVSWLLQNYLKQMDQFVVNEETLGIDIHWSRVAQESWRSLEGLLVWSIEQEAPCSVLEIIWSYMEDPVHAALIAASACRDTAERKHGSASYQDGLAKKELEDSADRFEKLAILVLEDLAQSGKGVEYLFQEPVRWQGKHNCFRLAHNLGCKTFVSKTTYRRAVDQYWMTPVPFHLHFHHGQLDHAKLFSWRSWLSLRADSKGQTRELKICDFGPWQFFSIPYVQAWTNGIARCLFVALYSYAVFYRLLAVGSICFMEVLLFLWALGLALVELRQFQTSGFTSYINDFWNILDALHITVLLSALVLGLLLADQSRDMNKPEQVLEVMHAMNLLPCWIRVLQVLQNSEHFGTLLITIFGMAKDALKFFILVFIFCCAFSCAITPILFSQIEERDNQAGQGNSCFPGLTWAFWTIVGSMDEAALAQLKTLPPITRMTATVLVYILALVCNVLLVNLLIAVMNSTYEKNQSMSQTSWAFSRIEAVLEYDDESTLPPPLNLLGLLLDPFGQVSRV
ncbi:TRPM8 [Symbiodinium sp. CCMP2592]|nr:TRPM8 [Symbiodinium sp. CCMP2592]